MINSALQADGRSAFDRIGHLGRVDGPSRIELVKGALWTRRLRGQPLRLRCTAGAVWVTREGDPDDVVLEAGASYGGDGRGLLVVEALEEAEIAVSAGGTFEALRRAVRAAQAQWLVLLSLAAVYLIWGSTYFAISVGLETFPPFLLGGTRYVLAGSIMYAALRLFSTPRAPRPTLRQWGAAARVGVLLLVCGNGFIVIAQQWVSSGVAAVVVSTMPLWVAVFASVAGRVARRAGREVRTDSRVSAGEWVGLLVGFAGAGLLHLGGDLHAGHPLALLVVLAPVCWALGTLYSRSLPLPDGPMAVATEMLSGGVVMLALGLLAGERLTAVPSMRSLLAIGYLTVFGSIVAFSAYMFLLKRTRPAIATSYAYVNPLVAIALGIVLRGERASAVTWASAGVIAVGVVLLSQARAAR
jgi:drug/metabolite transporter (DMT)-like permease